MVLMGHAAARAMTEENASKVVFVANTMVSDYLSLSGDDEVEVLFCC